MPSNYHGIDLRIATATRAELSAFIANCKEPSLVRLAQQERDSRDRFAASVAALSKREPAPLVAAE